VICHVERIWYSDRNMSNTEILKSFDSVCVYAVVWRELVNRESDQMIEEKKEGWNIFSVYIIIKC